MINNKMYACIHSVSGIMIIMRHVILSRCIVIMSMFSLALCSKKSIPGGGSRRTWVLFEYLYKSPQLKKHSERLFTLCYDIYSEIRGGLLCLSGNLPSQIGIAGKPL